MWLRKFGATRNQTPPTSLGYGYTSFGHADRAGGAPAQW